MHSDGRFPVDRRENKVVVLEASRTSMHNFTSVARVEEAGQYDSQAQPGASSQVSDLLIQLSPHGCFPGHTLQH